MALALLGHVIMIISAVPGIIGGKASVGLFVLSLIVTGTGAGGFKSNISPLVAEQYRRTKPFVITTRSGERIIVDPTMTASRIYMVYVLSSRLIPSPTFTDLVFLSLYKYRRTHRANLHGLCGKGNKLSSCLALVSKRRAVS